MDIGSLLLFFALLILVFLFITRPLFDRKATIVEPVVDQREHERSALLAERDRLINALQELDFDYALGKIPEEDYPVNRAFLLKRGADILRKLDEMDQVTPQAEAEVRLEAAIAARRADSASSAPTLMAQSASAVSAGVAVDDDVEALLAIRRRERQGKSAGFCPSCGRPVQKADRFCPSCGKSLA